MSVSIRVTKNTISPKLARIKQQLPRSLSNVVEKQAVEIFNTAATQTPIDTSRLRNTRSAGMTGDFTAEFGYTQYYAPFVEYGHRIVRGGVTYGYVQGQYYLRDMVSKQQPKFTRDLQTMLREVFS